MGEQSSDLYVAMDQASTTRQVRQRSMRIVNKNGLYKKIAESTASKNPARFQP